ncbi:glycosyltransferase family 1 protein, partial [Acinetobacter baumannii]|nr:glycosyltransferase family 1 protein [Acinetobacter baumannii]
KDIFPEEFEYYKFGEPKFVDILSFAYLMRKVSKSDVKQAAIKFIDKKILLKELYEQLLEEKS